MLLGRLRDSFNPEDTRAEALRDESCKYIEAIHGVAGRATYAYHFAEISGDVHGWHEQGEYVAVSTRSPFPVLASIHEIGHALDAVFLNSVQFAGGHVMLPQITRLTWPSLLRGPTRKARHSFAYGSRQFEEHHII